MVVSTRTFAAACGLAALVVALIPQAQAIPWPGPDGFGYTGQTIPYAWNDISGTGTLLSPFPPFGSTDDGYWGPISLGFSFSFYGNPFTEVYLSTNGFLDFSADGGTSWFVPANFPSSDGTNEIVAAYWADHQSDCAGSTLHHETQGVAPNRVFIVQYTDWYHLGSCGFDPLTFQAQLYESSGCIHILHNAVVDDFSEIGVGIEDASETVGLEFFYGLSGVWTDQAISMCSDAPPVTDLEAVATLEDTVAHIDVLDGDADPDGAPLTLESASGGALGAATVSPGHPGMPFPHVDYAPNLDANTPIGSPDTYTYTVSDGTSAATQSNTVDITPVNDAPLATILGDVTVAEDSGPTTIAGWGSGYAPGPATAADEAPQTLSQAVAVLAPGLMASAPTVAPDGALTVAPAAEQCTPSPVAGDLTVTDSGPGTAPDVNSLTLPFLVTVACVNDAPVALDDAFEVLDNTATLLDVLDNPGGDDYDVDTMFDPLEPMDVVAVGTPAFGTAVAAGGGIQYTPPAMWTGETGFDYTISDGEEEDTAWVDVVVGCPSLKALPDLYLVPEDGVLSVGAADGLLANDVKPDGALDVLVAVSPLLGTVEVLDDGSFTYTPFPDAFGTDTFSYRFKDTGYCTSKGTVTIAVAPVNDEPDAMPDTFTVAEDAQDALLDVLANDLFLPDAPETLTVVLASPAGVGELAVTPGAVYYTPPPDWYGTTSFTYTIADGNGGFDAAPVQVNVLNVDDAPHVHDDSYRVLPGEATSFGGDSGVLGNDVEVDGQSMTAYLQQAPTHGALVLHPDGSFKYTPHQGFTGWDSFLYYATDGSMGSAPAVATIEVVENLPPVASFQASPENVVVGEPIQFLDFSYDLDGEIVDWDWDFGDGSTSSLPQPLHTFLSAGATTVTLTVYDEDDGFATATWSPLVTQAFLADAGGANGNGLPLADAGPDQVVVQGDLVQLDGSGADGASALRWTWTQTAGPTVQLFEPGSMRPSFEAPALDDGPVALAFQLVVFDGLRASLPDEVQVLVLPTAADTARPQVVAGPDQAVAAGEAVSLEAYVSGFVPGVDVQVQWAQVQGPSVGPLPPGPHVAFRAPASGPLVFVATATDGIGDPVSDSLHVAVEAPDAGEGFRYQRGHQPIGLVAFETLVEGVQYRWDFGDGSRIEGPQPVHAYGASGTYMVTHRVTLEDGSVQTFREPVTVFANEREPRADAAGGLPWPLALAAVALVAAAAVAAVLLRRRSK